MRVTACWAGTYYVGVTAGATSATYNLVVTRGGDFSVAPNGTPAQAQNLGPATGELGAVVTPDVAQVGQNFEGLSYDDSVAVFD